MAIKGSVGDCVPERTPYKTTVPEVEWAENGDFLVSNDSALVSFLCLALSQPVACLALSQQPFFSKLLLTLLPHNYYCNCHCSKLITKLIITLIPVTFPLLLLLLLKIDY